VPVFDVLVVDVPSGAAALGVMTPIVPKIDPKR
jgi:hypothetical protein